jgi:16S rRNA (uracil1498-N3)-methyltransferase
MTNRYFCDEPIVSQTARVSGQEGLHLTKVMRRNVGDRVMLFDGTGAEFTAIITHIDRVAVSLQVESRRIVDRELPAALTLAVSLPKGDRQAWMVRTLVELGVSQLIPLRTNRAVAQPTASAIFRLRRQVIEASKQCGRNRLMTISDPATLSEVTNRVADSADRWLADPRGTSSIERLARGICFAVGPEGGFDNQELDAAMATGWKIVSLGPRILRVETAATALAASATLS